MRSKTILLAVLLLALLTGGCTATYIPISWGMGEKVQQLSRNDVTLSIFYERFDPKRQTLRITGTSFDQVMMPSEVKHHQGAYRADTKLIYRNMYQEFTDEELRNLMLHELGHHIWFEHMNQKQREAWKHHLEENPTPLMDMVRRVYQKPSDYDTEDFAFTLEFARSEDLEELVKMKLLTEQERDKILADKKIAKHPVEKQASAKITPAGQEVSRTEP